MVDKSRRKFLTYAGAAGIAAVAAGAGAYYYGTSMRPKAIKHVCPVAWSSAAHTSAWRSLDQKRAKITLPPQVTRELPDWLSLEWSNLGESGLGREAAIANGIIKACTTGYAYHVMHLSSDENTVCVKTECEGGQRCIARVESNIRTIQDLKGKKAAAPLLTASHLMCAASLEAHGINWKEDIEWLNVKTPDAAVLALRNKQVDFMVIWEPWGSMPIIEGWGRSIDAVYEGPMKRCYQSVLFYKPYVEEFPEAVQAIINAHYQVQLWYKENPDVWLEEVVKTSGLEVESAKIVMQNVWQEWRFPSEGLKSLAKLMYRLGIVEKDVSDKVDASFNSTFLEKATGKTRNELIY